MYDPGTTTFMIMSCALVLMMGPALALFYGGLSRRKNVVNTMLMCVMAMGAVGCLWAVLGDSIAYGGPDAFDEDGNLVNVAALFVGGFDRLFSSWSLVEMNIVRTWAGWIDITPDGVPVLGDCEEVPGLVTAYGFNAHGFGISPAIGYALSELIETGESSTIDISGLHYNRFKAKF